MATNKELQREHRYWVVKKKDADLYLTPDQRQELIELVDIANSRRIDAELGSFECVVVESDWPIYDEVWSSIEGMVAGQAPLTQQLIERTEEVDSLHQAISQTVGWFEEIHPGDGNITEGLRLLYAVLNTHPETAANTEMEAGDYKEAGTRLPGRPSIQSHW